MASPVLPSASECNLGSWSLGEDDDVETRKENWAILMNRQAMVGMRKAGPEENHG